MIFAKGPNLHICKIVGQNIRQIKSFQYLGIVFHSAIKHSAHQNYKTTIYSSKSEVTFSSDCCTTALFDSSFIPLERLQSTFLRAIFKVVHCVPNVILRKEAGLAKVK
ncbi:hypothetical protein E2320_020921, partial [Naja naja]